MSLPSDKPSLYDRRGATTLWRIVAEAVEKDIKSGRLKPGDRLPTEPEMASSYEVHRNTIRRAMVVLREKELVRVEQGRGTFVKERKVSHHLGAKTRLTMALKDVHRVGQRRYLGAHKVRLTKELLQDLELPRNRFARRVDTLTVVDDIVVSVNSNYFPLPRFEGIERYIEELGSFTESWKRYGVTEYKRAESRISAIALTKSDAELLSLQRGSPAIFITNINIDLNGVPIMLSHTRIAPQHMELVVRFD